MRHIIVEKLKTWWSNDFPGESEFTWVSDRAKKGGKMTGMDILEFRDIDWPALIPKNGAIG